MARTGRSTKHPIGQALNPAQAKTRSLAVIAAIREVSLTRGSVTIESVADVLDFPMFSTREELLNLAKKGLIFYGEKGTSGTIRLSDSGKTLAENIYLIRSGEQIRIGERL